MREILSEPTVPSQGQILQIGHIQRGQTLLHLKRGTNCGPLTLSQDGTQLLMTVNNGFKYFGV